MRHRCVSGGRFPPRNYEAVGQQVAGGLALCASLDSRPVSLSWDSCALGGANQDGHYRRIVLLQLSLLRQGRKPVPHLLQLLVEGITQLHIHR